MKFRTFLSWAVIGATVSLAFAADKVEMVPLKLDLPKPAYQGTPKDFKSDDQIEKLSDKARPEIEVPKGTLNLSLKKKVTASDDFPIIGKLTMVTDGEKDGTEGHWVELGPGLQWLQIDLEKSSEIEAIVLWHMHMEPRVYHAVIVQVSDDPDFIKGVTTLFNNDQQNDAGLGAGKNKGYIESNEGKLVEAKAAKARYVRLYSKGNTGDDNNQYTEVEVWGLPAK